MRHPSATASRSAASALEDSAAGDTAADPKIFAFYAAAWARGVQSASAFVGGEAPQPLPTEAEAMALDDEQAIAQYSRQDEETGETVSVLAIEGMHCAACSLNLESALIAVPGVRQVEVHGVTHKATIHWMPSDAKTRPSDWVAVIARAGYRAHPAMSAKAEHGRRMEGRRSVWRSFVSGFCMMQVMMYSVPLYYATELDMSADIRQLMLWASWILTIPVLLFAAGPLIAGAWQDVRHRRIGMDVPVALGIGAAFVASCWATLAQAGEVYFDSVTMFIFFLLSARFLEMSARHRAAQVSEELSRILPATATRIGASGDTAVPVAELVAGDELRGLQLAQGLADVAGDGVVVDLEGLDHAFRVDDEGAAQGQAFFRNVHAKGVGQGVGRVAHQRELGLAHGRGGFVPDFVREVGVGGDDVHFGASSLEFGVVVGGVFDFSRAVEGEGGRHEDQHGPLALQAFFGDLNELAVVESLGLERLNLGIDQRHRNSLLNRGGVDGTTPC